MKKKLPWLVTALLVLSLFGVTAVGAYQCGRGSAQDETPAISYASPQDAMPESYEQADADTRLWGRYRVQYYLKKKRLPWAIGNYYVYALPVTIAWPQIPNQQDIAAQIPVAAVFGNYEVCLNCPISVEVLRHPIEPAPVIELPEKPTKQ